MIEVDKDVPVPKQTCYKYPFHDMQVGDSFFIACSGYQQLKLQGNLAAAGRSYGRRHKCMFIARQVEGGVRCWRTE